MQLPPVPQHLLVRHPKRWVTVYFKLMGFSALDGEVRLPQTATIHMLESKIISHHGGSVDKLSLWRDRVEPSCVLRDFTLNLKEVFTLDDALARPIAGSTVVRQKPGQPEDHQVIVYYDYKAHDSDCPLLLRSPRYPQPVSEDPPIVKKSGS